MGKENAAKLERMVLLKQKSWARDEDQKRELAAVSGLMGFCMGSLGAHSGRAWLLQVWSRVSSRGIACCEDAQVACMVMEARCAARK